jgi:hypothetical protein
MANSAMPARTLAHPEPSDLDVAIRLARRMLDSRSADGLRESLRILLRALDAERGGQQ